MDVNPRLWMVSGERGAGKTTFCRGMAGLARAAGWKASGLLSPAVYEHDTKTGIEAESVGSGETHRLASAVQRSAEDLPLGKWYMDPGCLTWGNRVLAESLPCDLFIVDELGPLEFERNAGWASALTLLRSDGYRAGLVVIRPGLAALARAALPITGSITIEPGAALADLAQGLWNEISAV